MGVWRVEIPSGAINGTNRTFVTSVPYRAGSLALYLNGQLREKSNTADGYTETDPATGTLTLVEAPRAGELVQVAYEDTAAVPELLLPLTGTTDAVDDVSGTVAEVGSASGAVSDAEAVAGTVSVSDAFTGSVADQDLSGVVSDPEVVRG